MSTSTTTSTTTVASCFSPIEYLLKEAQLLSESSNGIISLYDAYVTIANKGLVLDSCNSCFCGCDYFLGPVALYKTYLEAYDTDYQGVPSCCVNVFSGIETYITAFSPTASSSKSSLLVGAPDPVTTYRTCCNGFNECFNELYKRLFRDDCGYNAEQLLDFLFDYGLVEQLTPGINSQICLLLDTLDEITNCGCYVDILLHIIENGLLIVCDDTGVVTINTFNTL